LGLESLPEEDKDQLTSGVVQLLSDRIILKIIQILTPEEREELGKLTDKGDEKEIADFIKKTIPGIDSIAHSEYESIKSEMVLEKDEINEAIDDYEKHHKALAEKNIKK
jgi:hypothetical protein